MHLFQSHLMFGRKKMTQAPVPGCSKKEVNNSFKNADVTEETVDKSKEGDGEFARR